MQFGNFYFDGSPQSLLLIVLTVIALIAAAVAVIVSLAVKSPIAPGVGCGCLGILGSGILLLGIAFGMMGKARVDNAMLGVDPSYAAMVRAEGERQYQQPMVFGVLGGALPLLAGGALGLLALKRRSENS